MGLFAWFALFLTGSLFWSWLLFWGGADWLEGTLLVALFVHFRAMEWSADGIKLFAVVSWICQTIWFLVGLKSPEVRLFG